MIDVADIDSQLTSKGFIADPYPVYRALGEADPVFFSKAWGVWVLTRYDDIVSILRDPHHFSNSGRFAALLDQLPRDVQQEMIPLRQHYSAGMLQAAPPDHTRLSTLVRDAFSARVIQNIRPHVQSVVDELID